uniref:Lipase domain-containing protein n=1 Tax=Prolemur simus TaxID=1328070 RepID=A0A8C8YFN4_PROSS
MDICYLPSPVLNNKRPCLEFSQLNVKDSFRDLFNPRIEIILMMYTRNNLNCAEPLFEHNNSLNINFNTQKKTVWLIHGYRPMGSIPSWLQNFLRILLNEEDVNIIVVDWNRGATTFIYNRAVKNTRKVAENLSRHIKNLLVSLGILCTIHAMQYTVCYAVPQSGNKIHNFSPYPLRITALMYYIKNYCFDVLMY